MKPRTSAASALFMGRTRQRPLGHVYCSPASADATLLSAVADELLLLLLMLLADGTTVSARCRQAALPPLPPPPPAASRRAAAARASILRCVAGASAQRRARWRPPAGHGAACSSVRGWLARPADAIVSCSADGANTGEQ